MIRITINAMLNALTASILVVALSLSASPACGDVLELKNGGRIDGILLNPEEEPRTKFVMRLETGGRMTVAFDQVKKHVALTDAQRMYQINLRKMPATAEANWIVAEWCLKVGLRNERKLHLEATIQLDPDHAQARRKLGYKRLNGEWTTTKEFNEQRGRILHEGQWRLPQDVEIAKQRREADLAAKKWAKNIKRWRGWLGKTKDREGYSLLKAIEDPLAAPALADALKKEILPRAQFLYVNALGKMSGPVPTEALTNVVLNTDDLDLRDKALDGLERNGRDLAVDAFIHALGNKNNAIVNRAATGLYRMPETRAIRPLIDALQTKHTSTTGGGNPGQLSTSFGGGPNGGGIGLGAGGSPTTESKIAHNRDVLQALLQLSEGADFQYNQIAWRNWYATKDVPRGIDLRRRP